MNQVRCPKQPPPKNKRSFVIKMLLWAFDRVRHNQPVHLYRSAVELKSMPCKLSVVYTPQALEVCSLNPLILP